MSCIDFILIIFILNKILDQINIYFVLRLIIVNNIVLQLIFLKKEKCNYVKDLNLPKKL